MTSRKTGLLRLAHLREVTEAKAEDMESQRARFARLADPGTAPRVVSSFNLFQTPPDLAAYAVSLAGPVGRTLEPSAGLGRIYRALRDQDEAAPVVLVESSADCCGELYRETEGHETTIFQRDFLTTTPAELGLFARIVMNPPFKMGRDVKHIDHARQFLAPGGVLVSFCYDGSRQNAKLRPDCDRWEVLPAGSFKSEGTNAGACLVTFRN